MPHVSHCTCAIKSCETMTSLLCRIKQIPQKITHTIKTTPMMISIITFGAKNIPSFLLCSFLIFFNITINVLRIPNPCKIRVLKPFCHLLVPLSKLFRTTKIVIRIIYITLNSSIFLFFSVFLPPL